MNGPQISRRAAAVKSYLRSPHNIAFIAAVDGREEIGDIAQPYRSWLEDVRNIPEDARATYTDFRTGEEVVRQILANI